MMGVPANYLLMAQEPRFADGRPLVAAAARSSAARRCRCRCSTRGRERGVEIVQGYGLTEAAPNVLCLPPEDARRKAGSAGKPYPYVECRLSGRGRAARARPERLRRLLAQPGGDRGGVPDGWLLTGDIAERDDEGYYWIRGRLKELIVSGGENVYPAEVEAVLHAHPAVVEAAVVGVPDERWGEVCAAFVVLRARARGAELRGVLPRAAGARSRCRRASTFVDALPRNSLGKVQKSELRVPQSEVRGRDRTSIPT